MWLCDGHSRRWCGTVQAEEGGSGPARCLAAGHGAQAQRAADTSPAAATTPAAAGAWRRLSWVRHYTSLLGLLQKQLVLWALLQISLSLPGNLTLLFYHVVTVLVFTAYLCYSHPCVYERSTLFPSSCGCFMSYNWKLDLKSHECSHRLTFEYWTVFWLCWHKHVYLIKQSVKAEKVPGFFLL